MISFFTRRDRLPRATALPASRAPAGGDALYAAIAARQFEPFYQPQVDLASGRVLGVEILARWRTPGGGIVMPAAFIPAMEETPLIDLLTEQLLERALRDARDWADDGIKISMNIAARTLADPDLSEWLATMLGRLQVPAARLTLELTETVLVRDLQSAQECALRLQAQGFRVAIDDFGTGYSSMALLLDLPFSELKIDRSFVTRLADSGKARILLESMIALGARLGMSVIAEGVESRAEAELLADLGCDAAQGYHVGRPMPQQELLAWLARRPAPSPNAGSTAAAASHHHLCPEYRA